jgi:hypothetical protein
LPRLPVDGKKVQEFRITMGTKERQLAESALNAYRIKSIVPSIAEVLGDVSALYALGSIWELLTGREIPGLYNPEEIGDAGKRAALELEQAIKDDVKSWSEEKQEEYKTTATTQESQEVRQERAKSLTGGILNMFDTFFAVVSGGHFNQWMEAREPEYTVDPDYVDPGLTPGGQGR